MVQAAQQPYGDSRPDAAVRNRTVTFIIADDRALIYHPSPDSDEAVVEKVPGTARHYLNQFEEMWEHGKQDPEFRNVPI